jgi:serine/threonine protein kinase
MEETPRIEDLYTIVGEVEAGVSTGALVSRATGEKVAIKHVVKRTASVRSIESTRREIVIMMMVAAHRVPHPHVVEFLGVFETPQAIDIVMETIGGGCAHTTLCLRYVLYGRCIVCQGNASR